MDFDLNLNVMFQNNDYVKQLEQEKRDLQRDYDELKRKFQKLDQDYAYVQCVNIELIDTMKLNGYKFRKQADVRTWGIQKGER